MSYHKILCLPEKTILQQWPLIENLRHFVFPLSSYSGSESQVSAPKKLDLTKENLNALLSQNASKQKNPSTLSRGSAQTSGGRGPGKGQE